ncbi:MAG TPA: hypothetical protein VKQ27_02365 [Acetobacteraceae bacterium]|nr:hypothetical protein [Acetobacteraceae bacterium]
MQRAGAGGSRRGNDLLAVQIRRDRCAARDRDRLVCQRHRGRPRIDLVIDHDAAQPELAQRPDDPDRDLAAVGNQDAVEGE